MINQTHKKSTSIIERKIKILIIRISIGQTLDLAMFRQIRDL